MASSSSSQQPLLYACIAYGTTILTEHTTSAASNASGVAPMLLPQIKKRPDKKTVVSEGLHAHYIAAGHDEYPASARSAGGLTYVVVTRQDLQRRIAFGFLISIQKRFLAQYPETTDFSALPAFGAGAFNGTLKKLMIEQGTTEEGQQDAIRQAKSEIDAVRNIMTENIERVLERGERIDLLVDKTDRLGGSATDFRVRSRGLRRRMWWKNVKLMVLLVLVVIFLLYLFVGFGCGLPGWGRCLGH
ncbi:synaptobrevin-like protein [Pseudovirgaria hyperparasitica]|uniref:Synaptobrevin homolog YKT6 n=1 Tax=Pseudovirgaria hyperparasitica TaxID=470096 RepID=A0A6A6VR11_9PEZI|nr:synaptobrevin-like protein [Pseudovirgaria hyperparasitica]KAF2753032.1 synaptobrevin-like protein [Pseudovirgaria hyperparasitica]